MRGETDFRRVHLARAYLTEGDLNQIKKLKDDDLKNKGEYGDMSTILPG